MKRTLLLTVFSISICGFANTRLQGNPVNKFPDREIVIENKRSKKNVVKISPNPSHGKLSVSSTNSEPLHFYIFDMEGTLVYQTILKNKEKKNIEDLKTGTYLYDAFEKDQSIEEGNIIVK